MKNLIRKDFKNLLPIFIIYLILQYVAIFLIEKVGMLVGTTSNNLLEYFYYFLMIVAVIYLTLGSLLLLIYIIIKPSVEDKKLKYELSEGLILYRISILIVLSLIAILNFFLGLTLITGFDFTIIFKQSLQFYIGINFILEVILSIILIINSKIFNNKFFVNKQNFLYNLIILIIIYISGNLYYFYYFKYGMIVLLLGYIFIFLNIKQITTIKDTRFESNKLVDIRTININTKTRNLNLIWIILLIILSGLIILSAFKGEIINKEENQAYVPEKAMEQTVKYDYEQIKTDFGTIKHYTNKEFGEKYIFEYNDKLYSVDYYTENLEGQINIKSLSNLESTTISTSPNEYYYIQSYILNDKSIKTNDKQTKTDEKTSKTTDDQAKSEDYLMCSGEYTLEEITKSDCLDKDVKDVLNYIYINKKK